VIDRIALWLLIHGGAPAPIDGSSPNIREQATIELIKQLASTLKDASLGQNIQAAIAGHRVQALSKPVAAQKKVKSRNRAS
jgi:sortase (surface protein transpeptidase)